jgi:ABC-type amino acid transport system permease subunit
MSQELSEMFYTFLITSVIGLLLGIGRICYKSKCSSIDICCIKVVRNIDAEVKEDLELANEESKK